MKSSTNGVPNGKPSRDMPLVKFAELFCMTIQALTRRAFLPALPAPIVAPAAAYVGLDRAGMRSSVPARPGPGFESWYEVAGEMARWERNAIRHEHSFTWRRKRYSVCIKWRPGVRLTVGVGPPDVTAGDPWRAVVTAKAEGRTALGTCRLIDGRAWGMVATEGET